MRIMVEFEKGNGVKYISHLDLMRTMQRSLRKSGLPITYSKGYSPHVNLAFSPPLSVGIIGLNELMDVPLSEKADSYFFIELLNKNLPNAIRANRAKIISTKEKSFMALTQAAEYTVILNIKNQKNNLNSNEFLNQNEIKIEMSSKKEKRIVDIKDMIYMLEVNQTENNLTINTILSAASNKSLHIKYLLESIFDYFDINKDERNIENIFRNQILTFNNENIFVPIFDFLKAE